MVKRYGLMEVLIFDKGNDFFLNHGAAGIATKMSGGFGTWPPTWLSQLKTNVKVG